MGSKLIGRYVIGAVAGTLAAVIVAEVIVLGLGITAPAAFFVGMICGMIGAPLGGLYWLSRA